MIFNTFAYYLFFLIPSAVLFRLAPAAARPWVLAAAGAAFYAYFAAGLPGGVWNVACLGLFVWEALFRNLYSPGAFACRVGVYVSLGVLAVFKYWNFLTGAATALFGENPLAWPGAFLPLGVSFFTFEFIHYAVDRRRGRVERGSAGEYLAFIFFFPTMVAGPIKRFQDFLPCLRSLGRNTAEDWNRGATRILTGCVKKFAGADLLTSLTDHLNHTDVADAPRWLLLIWVFAYGWKIYFDFSAYSDIAIGSGRLFGIIIPENFNWPYFSADVATFWRSWHMSLNRWLVDYVFIPLGGSRGSPAFACRNVFLVMLVSGLWHGAGWNFLLWGAWHGVLLAGHRLWAGGPKPGPAAPRSGARRFAGWAATYGAVNLGWAFFAMDAETALLFFHRLFAG